MLCETLVSLDVRDIEGRTALHLAAQRGFTSCVEVLLKHQASYTLKEHRRKWTALHAAGVCSENHRLFCGDTFVFVTLFLKYLFPPACLHCAAAEGQMDCLLLLVNGEQNADVIDSPDTQGQ